MTNDIKEHYKNIWNGKFISNRWYSGPMKDVNPDFEVLIFPPGKSRDMWTYATCGMSDSTRKSSIELHLFSTLESESLVELMTLVAYFNMSGTYLNQNHTVNFGRSWLPGSKCDHGLISLPYLDGPDLENYYMGENQIRFLWMIPVTRQEVEYKKRFGAEALEDRFEEAGFNYLDPKRNSVV